MCMKNDAEEGGKGTEQHQPCPLYSVTCCPALTSCSGCCQVPVTVYLIMLSLGVLLHKVKVGEGYQAIEGLETSITLKSSN